MDAQEIMREPSIRKTSLAICSRALKISQLVVIEKRQAMAQKGNQVTSPALTGIGLVKTHPIHSQEMDSERL